jgi:peptide/nickel transport system ATP-binding protein
MAMVMQDPKFSLNPVMTRRPPDRRGLRIGATHQGTRGGRDQALAALEAVQIRDPERVLDLIRMNCRAAWASG